VIKPARLLSYVSALLASLTLMQPIGLWPALILRPLKMLASAWTPFLALGGGLGALLGLARRDRRAVVAGLFGAAVAVRHIRRVTAPHDDLDAVRLGEHPDRLARTLPELPARLSPQRYRLWPAALPRARWQRDLVVGCTDAGSPLLADLWQPPPGIPHTGLAVVYLHGSGWHLLDKDIGTRPFFRRLAGQGHVVLDVAYTLAPRAQLHAMMADVKRAIAWMKAHAADYQVSPERIVLAGGSAGGHLALLAAYTPNDPEFQPAEVTADTSVRAVVSYYGPPDLVALHRFFEAAYDARQGMMQRLTGPGWTAIESAMRRARLIPSYGRWCSMGDMLPGLLGGGPDEVPELYRTGSPLHHVGPRCPPTLLVQGLHDMAGMAPEVRRLHHALRQAGVPSACVELPDTDHAFDLLFPLWSPAAQAATWYTERFLARMASHPLDD
jgi:acetyl esterase/lipase